MSTFGFLVVTDLKKFKNHLLEIKKKPWKLLIYIFYIAWMGFMFWQLATSQRDLGEISNLELKQDILSAIIKFLVILMFGYTLYSGTKEFGGLFSMGDVNFLFTSPISPRIILAYSMLKQSLLVGLSGFFILFMFPAIQAFLGIVNTGLIVHSMVGVVVLFTFTVPFSYLSFILSTRYGLRNILLYLLYGLVLFVLGGMAYGITMYQDVLQGVLWFFEQPFFSYIPIIGWSAELIQISFLGRTPLSNLFLVLQLLTIGIIYFLAVVLAQDYYEDAVPHAERMAMIRRISKEGGNSFSALKSVKKRKVREVHVREVGQGPWAFLWMRLVISKRSSGSLLLQWNTFALLVLSIAAAFLIPGRTADVFFGIAGGISYLLFLLSVSISIDGELKMKYIFILPGEPWKKLIALNTIPVLKTAIYLCCVLLPLGIIWNIPMASILAGLLFPLSMTLLNLYTTVIIHILIPNSFDLKAFFPVIRIFSFLLFLLPPGAAGIIVGIVTNNVTLAFYTIAGMNLLLSGICLAISNRAFGRLEVR